MPLTSLLIALFAVAACCALVAFAQVAGARRHWRGRRRFAACRRLLLGLVFVLLALLGGLAGTALLGYRRLTAEALIARLQTRQLGAQHYAIVLELPDGEQRRFELAGDDWQLDARVIKWDVRAVVLGAPPLYQLDRISGRYRDAAQERAQAKSVVELAPARPFDLWHLKRRFGRWLPWIDADYGSAAYLPLVDDGRFAVTLAAAGGLVARPDDAATAAKLRATGW